MDVVGRLVIREKFQKSGGMSLAEGMREAGVWLINQDAGPSKTQRKVISKETNGAIYYKTDKNRCFWECPIPEFNSLHGKIHFFAKI